MQDHTELEFKFRFSNSKVGDFSFGLKQKFIVSQLGARSQILRHLQDCFLSMAIRENLFHPPLPASDGLLVVFSMSYLVDLCLRLPLGLPVWVYFPFL